MIPVTPRPMSRRCCGVPSLERKPCALDELGVERHRRRTCGACLEGGQLPLGRHVVGGTENEPDPLVAEVRQVCVRLLHRDGVVSRDARKVEVLGGCVDENDRKRSFSRRA